MLADSGAYAVGRLWGRRKLAPVLSPAKTWEGYLAGVVLGSTLTALLAWLWSGRAGAGTTINGWHGLVLGSTIAAIAPLGDLAISMVKRQVGVKHSGRAIPGHGGALDRVDSVLWASVIGYCYVLWVIMPSV
jgi:phosphatidate cytidylyltransferase